MVPRSEATQKAEVLRGALVDVLAPIAVGEETRRQRVAEEVLICLAGADVQGLAESLDTLSLYLSGDWAQILLTYNIRVKSLAAVVV